MEERRKQITRGFSFVGLLFTAGMLWGSKNYAASAVVCLGAILLLGSSGDDDTNKPAGA